MTPQLNLAQVLATVGTIDPQVAALSAAIGPTRPIETCRRCERSITQDVRGEWAHLTENGFALVVGCRAASFDKDAGWDDSLKKHWVAAPPKSLKVD